MTAKATAKHYIFNALNTESSCYRQQASATLLWLCPCIILENGNSINRWSLGAQLQNMALCRTEESNPKGVTSIRRMWNPLHLQHTITMSNDLRIKQKTKILLHCIQKSKTVLQMTCCKIKNQAKNHDRMLLPDRYFDQSIQLAKHHKISALTF
jgi:hypothetical protein